MELLLLADPSEAKIRSYLSRSQCFVALTGECMVGACVVQPHSTDTYELMSITIHPDHQRAGHGAALLEWIIEFYRERGARQLEVGTGAFGYQLAFYQRHGFRVTRIDHDFLSSTIPSLFSRTAYSTSTCCALRCGT